MNTQINVIKDDISKLEIDVIVNAANSSLLGGGGVDGAIHRAAGLELLYECETLRGCLPGHSKITKAYNLKAKAVIHTVGPVWRDGKENEDNILYNCYQSALALCEERNFRQIAFPCISTGVYNFPKERAARIAVQAVNDFLQNNNKLEKIVFSCFLEEDFQIYKTLLKI